MNEIIIFCLVAFGAYAAGRFHGLRRETRVREELATRNAEFELLHAELTPNDPSSATAADKER